MESVPGTAVTAKANALKRAQQYILLPKPTLPNPSRGLSTGRVPAQRHDPSMRNVVMR